VADYDINIYKFDDETVISCSVGKI